ncbi:hypothetical protein [Micromonospora haikouensis]|uniref:hypothetical protein n=1 Tax=Micromonospora haikouensis TaxID=686309 RepID=UPI0037B1BE74
MTAKEMGTPPAIDSIAAAADRLEPCAVPLLVEHLQAYDGRIAELTTTRDALQGLIDASNG